MTLNLLTQNYLTRGFWGDEAWTIGISRLPISEIIAITGQDFHPPFYYFLVHYLGQFAGWGEVPIRLLSTFFFLLVPILVYFLTQAFWHSKKRPSRLASGLAALLTLLSPILLTYAFEARSYGLLAMESVLSAYIFWRAKDLPAGRQARKGHIPWRLAYFLLGAVMVYTHYYAWFILLAHAVYLLIAERKKILPLLPAALGILAAQLPWLPTLFGQVGEVKSDYWIGAINSRTHFEFFLRVTGGDLVTDWQKPLYYLFVFILGADLLYRLIKRKFDRPYLFTLSWLIIPALVPSLISLTFMPVFFYRYLIFSAIPIVILTVQAVRQHPRVVLILVALAIAYMQVRVDLRVWSQYPRSMREATIELYEQKQPGSGPVYTVLPSFAEVMYYTAPHDEIIVTPEGLVQFSGKSLLDAYVRLGLTTIEEPPTSAPYWFLSPDKKVEYRSP